MRAERILWVATAAASLTACTSGPARQAGTGAPPRVTVPHVPTQAHSEGLGGRTAAMLISLFGQPALDLREGSARKLQFLNASCVLDAYLYPPREQREPVVTHIDARLPDGRDGDSAACIASLSQR